MTNHVTIEGSDCGNDDSIAEVDAKLGSYTSHKINIHDSTLEFFS